MELPILLQPQVEQLSYLPIRCGFSYDEAVAMKLPILLEPQVTQLNDLALQVWL